MTLCGFDFLILDMQHTEIAQAHFPALFGPFGENKPWPVVRAAANDYHLINWLFDQGAAGVLVPMTNSVDDAKRAVEAAKYAPLGRRSFGPFRAARYGTRLASYMQSADATATLIVQIEDIRAAEQIDRILDIAGIDAVFMGPNDLAYSMLKSGETLKANPGEWSAFARTPAVIAVCNQVMERCRSAGIPFGMTAGPMEEGRDWLQRGANFITVGSDFFFMRAGAEHFCGPRTDPK
jgi:2-keto-3-deoxy-L-rhamnonate aldolase RhmA